ncbi:MAG: tRNA-guanine transglycosylase [Gemmatimonadota bacterium]
MAMASQSPACRMPRAEARRSSGCTRYDRAYLRHLFAAGEMLGLRLLALHNVTFLLRLMADARTALREDRFASWSAAWLARYRTAAR